MRVVICGSPSWNFDLIVQDEIVKLQRWCRLHGQKLLVIHGGENGPEEVARKICVDLGIDQIVHPVNRAYGDSAWPRRNQLMLQERLAIEDEEKDVAPGSVLSKGCHLPAARLPVEPAEVVVRGV
ncbi:MAG: hypothetical protein ACWGQW_26015, partial [bacterium]